MIRSRSLSRILPLFLLAGASHVPAGCACTDELISPLNVQVRDHTGRPAAFGATGVAVHASGEETELMGWDSLSVYGNWDGERAGRYRVEVRKPGFKTATVSTDVDDGLCHIEPRTLRIQLEPDAAAVALTPVSFLKGDQVRGFPVSTGVRVLADTLEIVGNSGFSCGGLKAVAYRTDVGGVGRGLFWHVQVEPESWAERRASCGTVRSQPFEVRYLLPQGRTELMVTTAAGYPGALLFHGDVVR